MRYNYEICYTPGKNLITADALSSSLQNLTENNELAAEAEAHVRLILRGLPVQDEFTNEIVREQASDSICCKLKEFTISGWPKKNEIPLNIVPYYQYRHGVFVAESFLLKGTRVIIPAALQLKILNLIHAGHQGIVKSRARAKMSVWWIGLSSQLENLVRNCPNCGEHSAKMCGIS